METNTQKPAAGWVWLMSQLDDWEKSLWLNQPAVPTNTNSSQFSLVGCVRQRRNAPPCLGQHGALADRRNAPYQATKL